MWVIAKAPKVIQSKILGLHYCGNPYSWALKNAPHGILIKNRATEVKECSYCGATPPEIIYTMITLFDAIIPTISHAISFKDETEILWREECI